MAEQEQEHQATFNALIRHFRVRPTALTPFWNVAGFALGILPHHHHITTHRITTHQHINASLTHQHLPYVLQ
jgi:demethoxyubiquinone hydroxylase (CLK1/Coq7/Cat5 family)